MEPYDIFCKQILFLFFEHRRVFFKGFLLHFFSYIFISMYPLITLSISHCFKLLYFTITVFFVFVFFIVAQTGERECCSGHYVCLGKV